MLAATMMCRQRAAFSKGSVMQRCRARLSPDPRLTQVPARGGLILDDVGVSGVRAGMS